MTHHEPQIIRVHEADNVAVVVNGNGLRAGTQLGPELVVRDAIPPAHKVALVTIAEGAPVIRYGMTIGYVRQETLTRKDFASTSRRIQRYSFQSLLPCKTVR
ncbi:MAG TPA: UxaA family hydrolase [Acidobacteriaceae bacterium]|jgi:hypothetical protein